MLRDDGHLQFPVGDPGKHLATEKPLSRQGFQSPFPLKTAKLGLLRAQMSPFVLWIPCKLCADSLGRTQKGGAQKGRTILRNQPCHL